MRMFHVGARMVARATRRAPTHRARVQKGWPAGYTWCDATPANYASRAATSGRPEQQWPPPTGGGGEDDFDWVPPSDKRQKGVVSVGTIDGGEDDGGSSSGGDATAWSSLQRGLSAARSHEHLDSPAESAVHSRYTTDSDSFHLQFPGLEHHHQVIANIPPIAEGQRPSSDQIVAILAENKGRDIAVYNGDHVDVDHLVIATALSLPHVRRLMSAVVSACKSTKIPALSSSSIAGGRKRRNYDWEVIDMGNLIIHIMTSEVRDQYNLEEMWQEVSLEDVIQTR